MTTTPDDLRRLLEDVAAGRLAPDQAAARLGAVEPAADDAPGPARTADPVAPAAPASPPALPDVAQVLVRGTSRRVRLVGDPGVATVAVEGPHTLRREGGTLVVAGEGERPATSDAFALLTSGRWRDAADFFSFGPDLVVRVRPDLPVEVEVTAGSLSAEGVAALRRVRVTAGSATVTGVREPLDLLVQAGSARVTARPTGGKWRLRAESGSLSVTLEDGSDARVHGDVQLGRLTTDPATDGDLLVGLGAAEVLLEVVMGSASVTATRSGAGAR